MNDNQPAAQGPERKQLPPDIAAKHQLTRLLRQLVPDIKTGAVDDFHAVIDTYAAATRHSAEGGEAQAIVREYFKHFPCTCGHKGGRFHTHFAVCPITIRKELLERLTPTPADERAQQSAQRDPDHLNPAKGGTKAADDYW